jgi:hypothetical protein
MRLGTMASMTHQGPTSPGGNLHEGPPPPPTSQDGHLTNACTDGAGMDVCPPGI